MYTKNTILLQLHVRLVELINMMLKGQMFVSMWSYVDMETPLKDDHLPESNPERSSSNKCLFYCCTCVT